MMKVIGGTRADKAQDSEVEKDTAADVVEARAEMGMGLDRTAERAAAVLDKAQLA